jgi:hypothetical protein
LQAAAASCKLKPTSMKTQLVFHENIHENPVGAAANWRRPNLI